MKLHNISFNNLRRRKSRMLFLVLGLTIAVSTVVVLITLSDTMNMEFARKLDEFGANILIVPQSHDMTMSYGGMTISDVALDVQKLTDKDVVAIRDIKNSDNIKIIAPKLLTSASIGSRKVMIVGVDFERELELKKWWRLTGGHPKGSQDAVVGAEASIKLGLAQGQTFEIKGDSFTVSAVLEATGSQDDGVVFIPLAIAQSLFGKPNQVSMIEVAALCYDCPIEEIVAQTSEKLPGARVMAIRQTIESKMEAMRGFEHFSYGVSGVVVLVAALIVITNMTSSVNERRREIGVFRAIGFRQTHIIRIILTEAFVVSLLAGLMGSIIGFAASNLAAPFLMMDAVGAISVSLELFVFALALALSVGMASSVYPAFKASRLDPTIALKAL